MLIFIKEYDFTQYSDNVAKLCGMMNDRHMVENEKSVIDFFSAVKERVGKVLDTCKNASEYASWCGSDEARQIDFHAKNVISEVTAGEITCFNQLVKVCAEEAAYLVSSKCAHFYTED